MKLLCQLQPALLERETASYREHMLPLVEIMGEQVRRGTPPAASPTFRNYSRYLLWCIRRLEYSYALDLLEPGRRVLDVGCGVTPFPHAMARLGCRVDAIDPCREDIELASRHSNRAYGAHVRYQIADARDLPFDGGSFDLVTCISVLEHMSGPEARKCIAEIRRVLHPTGRAVFTTDFIPRDSTHRVSGTEGGLRRCGETPYQLHTLRKELVECPGVVGPGDESFWEECAGLTEERVKSFWRQNRFPDCLYATDRCYVAVGFQVAPEGGAA